MTDMTADQIVAADRQRSAARIADVELGLQHPVDAHFWRFHARARVACLEEDGEIYGLLPHEEDELARLKELLA